MAATAQSALLKAKSPSQVGRGLGDTLAKLERPAGCLVFVSGGLATALTEVARSVADAKPKVPVVIAGGAGVLSEAGEIEGETAASILAWAGGRPELLVAEGTTPDEVGQALAQQISDRAGRSAPGIISFVQAEGYGPGVLEPLREARGAAHLFGAGAVGAPGVAAVSADGEVRFGGAVGLLLRGLTPPTVGASPACRLLMPLRRISETRGSMVVALEDEPALDVLSAVGQDIRDEPLVFAVLAEESKGGDERPQLLVRPVQGVDPVRRGLLISDEVRTGMRLAFAIRDASAARSDLTTSLREIERNLAGALPRFGIYLNCAGRGEALYGAADVDTRLIRSRFGDLPVAGMSSAFEIAPYHGQPALQLYNGVLGLFAAAS